MPTTRLDPEHTKNPLPLVVPLAAGDSAEQAFLRLASQPHCLFLDSSLRHSELGRYSYVTADPFEVTYLRPGQSPGLSLLSDRLRRYATDHRGDVPPFQGGAAGLIAYEFGGALERLPIAPHNEFDLPWLAMGWYDVVLSFDHQTGQAWLISQGFPETDPDRRVQRATSRAKQFLAWLEQPATLPKIKSARQGAEAVTIDAPMMATGRYPNLHSNFSADGYCTAVAQAIEYIRAGDVFQVNLSQRLLHPIDEDAVRLYLRMRTRTPATFSAYFDAGEFQVVSCSPERFVKVEGDDVEARPIKGTRRRTQQPEADLFAGDDLLASEKDWSENVMIVDLLRNDLSRVCRPDTLHVPQLCGLESYGYVQHLVSSVRGSLTESSNCLDVISAAFPGGSITGAPKLRAMEIITELEQVARGAYCGSLGYIGWNGCMDMSILIRTMTAAGGWWQLPVGGGIVAASTPAAEYQETWAKASGMLAALR